MAENEILSKKELFDRMLSQGRLHEAITMLKSISEKKMLWEVTDRITRVEEAYRYMLRYAMEGVEDPHRDVIYNNIKNDLRMLYDRLKRLVNIQSSATLYYTTLRAGNVPAVADACSSYRKLLHGNDAFSIAAGVSQGVTAVELESAETSLFESVWVNFPYSGDDENALNALMGDASIPAHVKILVISALMLGSMEFFDSRRALVLANVYASEASGEQIRMTALTALLLSLYVNRGKEFPPELSARISVLRDMASWRQDIKTVYLELIRTRDTERITTKLRDEIVPEMIKMKPEIDKRIKADYEQGVDPSELEENPEWQDFLESSGIADRMKELSEIQEEGGDVLMGTFSQLKSYPFFYNPANWFRPFYADSPVVAQLGDDTNVLGELIAQSFFMCDSDKYSFVLAFASMPEAQRNMMISQIKAQNINAAEIQNASLNLSTDTRKNVVNKYVQNLYRFFRLFRRRSDFKDPFASEINLIDVKPLQSDFMEDSTLQLVGEFYFKHQYYKEAFGVFKLREAHIFPDATLYQKLGYCQQRLGNTESAIKYYEQSELLTGNSLWTTKRLAAAHKQMGNFKEALGYYNRLDAMQPDKFATSLNIGQCQMALGQYAEASKAFYKAHYLDERSEKPMRLLAWSLLMQKDLDASQGIYDKILNTTTTQPLDYLNRGHVALVKGDFRTAINFYNKFVAVSPGGWPDFIREMSDDSSHLVGLGVDEGILPLVTDATKYADNL
ncbi:MAG: tetratricopeptide repeat protein [Muribaculaceae bacterium]|nr:tetratricopeptide repeat protein [Muribaculaceae bacterium]